MAAEWCLRVVIRGVISMCMCVCVHNCVLLGLFGRYQRFIGGLVVFRPNSQYTKPESLKRFGCFESVSWVWVFRILHKRFRGLGV